MAPSEFSSFEDGALRWPAPAGSPQRSQVVTPDLKVEVEPTGRIVATAKSGPRIDLESVSAPEAMPLTTFDRGFLTQLAWFAPSVLNARSQDYLEVLRASPTLDLFRRRYAEAGRRIETPGWRISVYAPLDRLRHFDESGILLEAASTEGS